MTAARRSCSMTERTPWVNVYCEDAISRTLRTLARLNLVSKPLLLSHTHTHAHHRLDEQHGEQRYCERRCGHRVCVGGSLHGCHPGGRLRLHPETGEVGWNEGLQVGARVTFTLKQAKTNKKSEITIYKNTPTLSAQERNGAEDAGHTPSPHPQYLHTLSRPTNPSTHRIQPNNQIEEETRNSMKLRKQAFDGVCTSPNNNPDNPNKCS